MESHAQDIFYAVITLIFIIIYISASNRSQTEKLNRRLGKIENDVRKIRRQTKEQ